MDYMLGRMGFGSKWSKWIWTCISTTSFAVMVNDRPSFFIRASRGFRQRDPLSPLLFFIVMETLSRLLERVRELDLIRGVNIGRGRQQLEITHLFFAVDTLLFCEPDDSLLLNLLFVLLCFQAVLGLHINLKKPELVKIWGLFE